MESWTNDIQFERVGLVRKVMRRAIINPLANYLPASWLKALLKYGESELAQANWDDPGGWKSMVVSYHGCPEKLADKLLVGLGAMSMALRNRRRLAGRILTKLIEETGRDEVYVLCLGAGPGQIIIDAMQAARCATYATLVDLSSDAFDYGKQLSESCGLLERMRYIQGDVRDIGDMLDHRPDVVKMLGICEYLTDEQIVDIAKAVAKLMHPGSSIVFNSISYAHGNDRFLRRVFGLHMNHRSPQQLQDLMAQAGFKDFMAYQEPLGVYQVIVGRL